MDDVLIEKIKSGNDHAFRVLVEKYRNTVFHTVYGVLRNEKDAEDAAQEVFIKIYTSLPQYEKQGFKTWITRIAVNHAIDIKRKQVRRQEDQRVEYEETDHSPPADSVELLVIKREKQFLIRKRLEEMPDNYREVVEGFYILEKSYQELAEEQNVQVKTIETKLYRARQWMKKHWKEDDFS
ncbi:RNA polymerase sigma factor [Lederbergia citrea]|uniref:Sigma-70 family RNA polymerase sigma factor n=1 Tax=Lederbergia citrea TaxID=2833581 RepID=A0A942Z6F3_9BACI|nr:sigma-70 family RNA polymerase sigma factor [Lederbergia citrea]MBS4179453.1 sigma-70 family RNA polymerase sigma factor [Lederbergia citrea]MBS4206121.1 sigma-70 family RNA polymerase sigma factor [Lederbergia citrea]MBS4224430.1 sigma-70 family RNA polymerase sigma factor [Lederbergia citrea]